jgi:hypothetical protein
MRNIPNTLSEYPQSMFGYNQLQKSHPEPIRPSELINKVIGVF